MAVVVGFGSAVGSGAEGKPWMEIEEHHREKEMEMTRWSMQKFLLISTLAPRPFFIHSSHKIKCWINPNVRIWPKITSRDFFLHPKISTYIFINFKILIIHSKIF